MLIGNWSDLDAKNDLNNLNQTKYYMILNEKKINLRQLNKHVLECILPQFDSYSHKNNFLENSAHPEALSTFNVSNTFINIYENEKLFCSPIPFKIKHLTATELNEKQNPSIHPSNQILSIKENINYKIKLFLLERTLMVLKYYNLNEIEFDYYGTTTNQNQQTNNSNDINQQHISSFEKRICKLITSLINHVLVMKAKKHIPNNHDSMKLALESEHEGKTLLHLSSEAGLFHLLDNLGNMRSHLQDDISVEFNLIKNELQLNKLDVHGNTPMVKYFSIMLM